MQVNLPSSSSSKNSAPNLVAIEPLKNWIIIDIEDRGGGETASGIILVDDDFKEWGIRPRWARVLAVGPKAREADIEPGGYVLVDHLDWSPKIGQGVDTNGKPVTMWGTHVEKVLGYDDTKPRTLGQYFRPRDFG